MQHIITTMSIPLFGHYTLNGYIEKTIGPKGRIVSLSIFNTPGGKNNEYGCTLVYEDNIDKTDTKIICVIGSTKYKKEFEAIIAEESKKGHIVLGPAQYTHADNLSITSEEADILEKLCFDKIHMADEVIVIMPDGYRGESTYLEINYAISLNKSIRYCS